MAYMTDRIIKCDQCKAEALVFDEDYKYAVMCGCCTMTPYYKHAYQAISEWNRMQATNGG